MSIWSKFTAWFSGWPESKERKQRRMEVDKLFEEVELKKKPKKSKGLKSQKEKKVGERKMTEITLLVLVLLLLVGCFFVVYYYDRKLVKAITEYEIRLDKKGILKRHFSKPLT